MMRMETQVKGQVSGKCALEDGDTWAGSGGGGDSPAPRALPWPWRHPLASSGQAPAPWLRPQGRRDYGP